jgi:MoaA/NifB/PqqE/SkfB family radical SAM enzyme
MEHYLKSPTKIQFELSSLCNAMCLGCVRTDSFNYNRIKPELDKKIYVEKSTYEKIIFSESFQSVFELEFCGSIDDPLMHPEFLEFLKIARTVKNYRIIIHTNASLRNETYFKDLANILNKFSNYEMLFSIDGLEDTHNIYRQNTSWEKIIKNAKAFIDAGGRASWQYLIFPWNRHQLDEAESLSKTLKFDKFMFRHDRSIVSKIGLNEILNRKKQNITKNTNTSLEWLSKNLQDSLNYEIACNNQIKTMYFIAHDSRIWPCCFLHNGLLHHDKGRLDILHKRLFDAYGSDDWNDCSKYTIEEILQHEFFTNDLTASWDSTIHGIEKGQRIFRCTEVCNSKKIKELPIGDAKLLYEKRHDEKIS